MSTDILIKPVTNVADRLKIVAEIAGSLKELSDRAQIPYQSLLRYLKGTEPKGEVLGKIVHEFGINGTWLLTGKGTPSAEPMGDTDNIEIPLFCEDTYCRNLMLAHDFSQRDELMRSARSEMFNNKALSFSRQMAQELFDLDHDNIVFFRSKRATGSASAGISKLFLINLNIRTPQHGRRMCVLHLGVPYILKALVNEDKETYLIDESPKDPLPSLHYDQLVREDCIVGKVVVSLVEE